MVAEKTEPERFLDRVREVGPDVVVLDLDAEEGPELARRIATAFSAVQVHRARRPGEDELPDPSPCGRARDPTGFI